MEKPYVKQHLGAVLNLESIETSLREVQNQFPRINQALKFTREPMDEEIVENLVSGYALINYLLAANIELFALGNSSYLLELNARVLCGMNEQKRCEYHKHIEANSKYFYERTDAGIQDLAEWYALHQHQSVWGLAAGMYIRILSEPQLFIEGNDRTGALMISYILAKESQPPLVLTAAKALAYFETSALIRKLPRNGLVRLFRLPFLKAQVVRLIRDQAQYEYLL